MAKKSNTKLIRVNLDCYNTVHALKGELTYSEFINRTIKAAEKLNAAPEVYLAGDKYFEDIKQARGEAIMQAIREQRMPEPPEVAIIVGKDTLT